MINTDGQIIVNIGLDVSFNCTGMCIFDTCMQYPLQFIRISSEELKLKDRTVWIQDVAYERLENSKKLTYGVREQNKLQDSIALTKVILNLLKYHREKIMKVYELPTEKIYFNINIEGNAMGGFKYGLGSIVDMVMISSILKSALIKLSNVNVWTIAPMGLKAFFVPKEPKPKRKKGEPKLPPEPKTKKISNKDIMIKQFQSIFPQYKLNGKVDDVIDGFALSVYVEPEFRDKINYINQLK